MLSLPRLLALQPLLLLLLENPRSSLSKEQEKDCPPARQNHVEVRIKGGGVAVEEAVNRGYVRDPETRGQTRGVGGEGGCVPVVLRGGHVVRIIRAIELAISLQLANHKSDWVEHWKSTHERRYRCVSRLPPVS